MTSDHRSGKAPPHGNPPPDSSGHPIRTRLARALRRRQTEAEAKLWSRLRNRRLDGLKFRRQVPVAGSIADFLCRDARLIVEIDGSQHLEREDADRERTEALVAAGFLVLRFWNNDVHARTDAVLEQILDHVVAARRSGTAADEVFLSPVEPKARLRQDGSGSDNTGALPRGTPDEGFSQGADAIPEANPSPQPSPDGRGSDNTGALPRGTPSPDGRGSDNTGASPHGIPSPVGRRWRVEPKARLRREAPDEGFSQGADAIPEANPSPQPSPDGRGGDNTGASPRGAPSPVGRGGDNTGALPHGTPSPVGSGSDNTGASPHGIPSPVGRRWRVEPKARLRREAPDEGFSQGADAIPEANPSPQPFPVEPKARLRRDGRGGDDGGEAPDEGSAP